MAILTLNLKGQVRGGKNSVLMTRSGRRYPNPLFVAWRENMLKQIKQQYPLVKTITDRKLLWTFIYVPEDNRRRDCPAVLDAVFHVLEKSKIVSDDCIIKHIYYNEQPADKNLAGIVIEAKGE